jgi:polyhydroxybutyrate depolymerase
MRVVLFLMLATGIALQLPTIAPAADGPLQSRSVAIGDGKRDYQLFVPGRKGPMPLVIALHGGGGNGAQLAKSAGLIEKAQKEGFILALPEGSARFAKLQTWNAGGCCAYAMKQKIDDVGFIRALIDDLERTQPVDPKRVYVVGMSNGGMMTQRVAIALSDRIAGAAVFVGALFGNEPTPVGPVPMLIVNAEKDEQVPVAGGTSTTGIVRKSQGMPYKPSRYAATWWASANNCTAGPARSETADYVRETWTKCVAGADVDFYITKDAEHGWPGGTIGRPGVTRSTGRVNGTDLMWAFFAARRR